MIELIAVSRDDVLAVSVAGMITDDDLNLVMGHLENLMSRCETVDVFVETKAIEGISLSGLPAYMARALPLFGKLSRFGRVAVVADQRWVRAGTRLESAILPNIEYRIFLPERRDEALAWVTDDA